MTKPVDSEEKPKPSSLWTGLVLPLASIVPGAILVWIASRNDLPAWAYLIPIFLVGLLAIIGVTPYVLRCIASQRSQRKHRVAMTRYKPERLAVISQFVKLTSPSLVNAPAHVVSAINAKPEYGGGNYTAESDHFRTLASWGRRVQANLRSSDGPFDLSAAEAMEYVQLYLQHVERIGGRIESQIGDSAAVAGQWKRRLSEWNTSIDQLNNCVNQITMIVVGIGEIVGCDYSDRYLPTLERLRFEIGTSESPSGASESDP